MGVNANFTAEFGSFLQALNEADKKLADFGANADKVGDQLNRMVDKFSGVKMIQQANELVKVVNDLGGATTLTEKEQAKLNATLSEAIAKYHAIGETVPADMQKLADETQGAATTTTNWVSSLQELAGAFGIAFSVGAVVNFGKELFADASALNTLSQQTRISIEDLQLLTAATAGFGVSGEELARALFSLQTKIAGGDESIVVAYAKMGLALDDVRGKDAKTLFIETERALGTLSGAAQDAAAQDLYGGKLGLSMVALSGGLDEALAKTKGLTLATGDSVRAMAEYSDAINRTTTSFKNWVTEGVGGALLGIETLNEKMGQGGVVDKLKIFVGGWRDWFETQTTGVQHTEHLTRVFDELNQKTLANTAATAANTQAQVAAKGPLATVTTEITDARIATEAWNRAQAEAAKAQAEADKMALDSYTKRIKSLELVTQATLKAYSFDGQISQLQALQAAEEDLARSVYAQIASEKDRMKILEDLAAKRTAIAQQMAALEAKHAGVVNQQVIDELTAKTKIMEAYGQQADGTLKINDAQTTLQRSLDDLHRKKEEGISQYYQEQALMDQFLKDQAAEVQAIDAATAAHDRETAAIQRKGDARDTFSLAGGSAVPDKFKGWSSQQLQSAGYVDAYHNVTPLGESMGLGFSGGGGRLGMAPARAGGGPVESGGAYLVGEQGPELFVPSQSGSIVPNGAGVTVHNVFNIVDTESNIARRVADQITRSVMRSTRLS